MSSILGLLPLVLIFVVMYFLLIRPQQKRSQEQQKLVASLEPGDEVVTIGGIFGDIVEVDDGEVILEVYDGTQMRFLRSAIARKVLPESEFEEEEIDLVEEEGDDVEAESDDDAAEAADEVEADEVGEADSNGKAKAPTSKDDAAESDDT